VIPMAQHETLSSMPQIGEPILADLHRPTDATTAIMASFTMAAFAGTPLLAARRAAVRPSRVCLHQGPNVLSV